MQRQQLGQHGSGQDIAAFWTAVAENAVVEQVIGFARMFAEKGQVERSAGRLPGLEVPEIGGQRGEAHRRVDAAIGEKHRLVQRVVAKSAAPLPVDRLGNATLFAGNDLFQARDAVSFGVFTHFHADPAPAHFVSHGGGRAGAEEGVENEIIRFRRNFQNSLHQTLRFWGLKGSLFTKQQLNFSRCVLI